MSINLTLQCWELCEKRVGFAAQKQVTCFKIVGREDIIAQWAKMAIQRLKKLFLGPCERKEVSHLIVSHSKLEIYFIFSLFGTERRQLAGNFGVTHARIPTVKPEITNPPLPASCALMPSTAIANFRFGICLSESPTDLQGRPLGHLRGSRNPLRCQYWGVKVFTFIEFSFSVFFKGLLRK